MTDPTAAFFDELGRRGHEPLLDRATGSLRFDLADGRRTVRWVVATRKGDVTVSRKGSESDCVVRGSKALFDRLAAGEANAMTALLRGELAIEGDYNLLVLFQRLFPGPPRARNERRPAGSARGRS